MSHPETEKPNDRNADSGGPRPIGESPIAPTSPFVEYYRPPRLGIIHLLAWMTATAIVLKIDLAIFALNEAMISRLGIDLPQPSQLALVWAYAVRTIYSIAQGAGLVGAAVLLRAWRRGMGGRLQPGHWIVLIEALCLVASRGWELSLKVLIHDPWHTTPILVLVGLVAFFFILCRGGLYLYVAWRKLREKRWRRLFIVVGVLVLIEYVPYFVPVLLFRLQRFSLTVLMTLAFGMALAAVVTLDLRARCRRDWVHWLCVAILMMPVLMRVRRWVWAQLASGLI